MIRSSLITRIHSKPFPKKYLQIYQTLKRLGVLRGISDQDLPPDEPQFYSFSCRRTPGENESRDTFGYGFSQNRDEAFTVAVCEAIEYYSITHPNEKSFIQATYKQLGSRAVDPGKFRRFSTKQLEKREYRKAKYDENTPLHWVEGFSLTQEKSILVPAQVVYANYNHKSKKEPFIEIPNSTGSACGENISFATLRGLCEVIERDAYMISFINRIIPKRIRFDDAGYASLLHKITRYDLEVYPCDVSLDFSPTAVACILLDKTGSGPAVSAGLGCHPDPYHASKTALFEAVRNHISGRKWFFRETPIRLPAKNSVKGFLARKKQWLASPLAFRYIEPFLQGNETSVKKRRLLTDTEGYLQMLIAEFAEKNYEVIRVDVTPPEVEDLGLRVTKVLAPDLVPLWLDERTPYLNSRRLYEIPMNLGLVDKQLTEGSIDPRHPF